MTDDTYWGAEYGLTFVIIMGMLFVLPFVVLLSTDYYSILTTKDNVDHVIKREITLALEEQINDDENANREIGFDIEKLKEAIIENSEREIKEKYKINFTMTKLDIQDEDKFYFFYEGLTDVKLKLFKNYDAFRIRTVGRSKVQRFDWEQGERDWLPWL